MWGARGGRWIPRGVPRAKPEGHPEEFVGFPEFSARECCSLWIYRDKSLYSFPALRGGGLCSFSVVRGEEWIFHSSPRIAGGDAGSFPVVRGGNADSLLIYLFIRNGQFWVNLERIFGDVDFIELEKMLNFN